MRTIETTKTAFVSFLFATTLAAAGCIDGSSAVTLTDLDTGRQITMEDSGDSTIITDLETGESIEVEGNLAGTMTDEEYTALMRGKRTAEEAGSAATSPDGLADAPDKEPMALWGTGSFSIHTSFETPKYKKTDSTYPVKTILTATTYNPSGDAIRIELFRSVPFWFDYPYGLKDYWLSPQGVNTATWSSATPSADYYVRISKSYNNYWSVGTYTLTE
jgi:hypothetical protein